MRNQIDSAIWLIPASLLNEISLRPQQFSYNNLEFSPIQSIDIMYAGLASKKASPVKSLNLGNNPNHHHKNCKIRR